MAEFDAFALNYDFEKSSLVKELLGVDDERLVRQKSELVLSQLDESVGSILDYGCGTGDLLTSLIRSGPRKVEYLGTDISSVMIGQAKKKFPSHAGNFFPISDLDSPTKVGRFDAVIMSSVLHHVEPSQLTDVLHHSIHLLRPGGRLIVMEHNSLNLITQLAVSMTPVDKNATLVNPRRLSSLLKEQDFREIKLRYFLFFPPGWPLSSKIDDFLGRIPLGGQWLLTACRRD